MAFETPNCKILDEFSDLDWNQKKKNLDSEDQLELRILQLIHERQQVVYH